MVGPKYEHAAAGNFLGRFLQVSSEVAPLKCAERDCLNHLTVLFICARHSGTVHPPYKQEKIGLISLTYHICLNIEWPDSFLCLSIISNLYRNKFLLSSQILHFCHSLYRKLLQAGFSLFLLIPVQNSIKTNTS